MKVQKIQTEDGYRYIILDTDYRPVEEINIYLKYLDLLGCSVMTLKSYAFHLKRYLEYLETINLTIKTIFNQEKSYLEILVDYISCLRNEKNNDKYRTEKTINYMITPVIGMYEYLAALNIVPAVNFQKTVSNNNSVMINKSFLYETTRKIKQGKILYLKVNDDEIYKYITKDQYDCFIKSCRNLRDKILLALLFECGLRIGEALGIHLGDIDLWAGEIQIIHRENNMNEARVKNKAVGVVYLPDYVIDWLIEYISTELIDYEMDYLFINLYGKNKGRPLTKSNVQSIFNRLSNNTGIKVHPHMLRHGFGTMASESGIKPEIIKEMMRHKNVSTTMKYIHFTNDRKKEAAIKLQESRGESVEVLRKRNKFDE